MIRYSSLFILLVFISVFSSCKKDLVEIVDTNTNLTSDLEKTPEILYGSWNLNQNISDKNTNQINCEAENIHFLENDSFYLQYQEKRIKGTYKITGPTSIDLSVGSTQIGLINNGSVDQNKISLEIEITDDCSGTYDGEKYFRVHQFIWESLNELYLWQAEVDDLSDNIKPVGSSAYNQLISTNQEPEAFFESLKHPDDRHSRITSNFEDLENSIKGIDASNGVEFILFPSGTGNGVLGIVTHILENSDAFSKDIKRGDVFMGVNGELLSFNNFYGLLYGDQISYTLNMANKNGSGFSLNGKNIDLIKEDNFQTNPIQVNKVIQMGGKKIAYLMYTQFSQGFDQELNSVFSEFKSEGVDELILDLRYNRGGLTKTALYLSGMITGQFTGQIFSQKIWNKKVTDYYESIESTDWMKDLFVSEMDDKTVINSLNLNRVYIITSSSSASASEMLINGLSPFINVIQVGEATYGKNVGGLAVVYDYIDNTNRTINPDHSYAISPITFRVANSEGFSDYANGLKPSDGFELTEDVLNMGVLGDSNEPLLALALNDIIGNSARLPIITPKYPIENIIEDPKSHKSSFLFMLNEELP
tara:strand:- start:6671 stop:8440 length:1770 start_codon:yes stop_codon:yes gene_type:complete